MDKTDTIGLILRALPYPHQAQQWEVLEGHVCFTWRGVRYRVDRTFLRAEEVTDEMLIGTDRAILLTGLLHRAIFDKSPSTAVLDPEPS